MAIINNYNLARLLSLLILWCVVVNAYAAIPPPLLVDLETMNWHIYQPGAMDDIEQQMQALSVPGQLTNWQPQTVPGLIKQFSLKSLDGRIWYRLQFDAGAVAQEASLGLLLGHILEANRVWLNQQLLGQNGKVHRNSSFFISDHHSLRYYPIASGLLQATNNILIVEVQALATRGGIISGPLGITHSEPAWRYKGSIERPKILVQNALLVLVIISLIVGLVTLLILRRFNTEHVAFVGLFLAILVTFGINTLGFYQTGLKTEILQRIVYVFTFLIAIFIFYYTRAIIGLSHNRFTNLLLAVFVTGSSSLYFVVSPQFFGLLMLGLGLCVGIGMLNLYITGIPAIRNGNLAVASVLVGVTTLGATLWISLFHDPYAFWLNNDELGMGIVMLSLLVAYVLRLMAIQKQLRDMSVKLVNTSEQERKHLARELHDGINQRLATTRLRLQMHQFRTQDPELKPLSNELLIAMEEMDRLVQGLQPFNLERHSLAQAMQLEAQGMNSVKGLNIEVLAEELVLPKKLAQHLYRIFQESVQNALKHANAEHIYVELSQKRNRLTLSISDDGQGFNEIKSQNNRAGIGMISLHERVALICGILQIDSQPDKGTTIIVQVDIV